MEMLWIKLSLFLWIQSVTGTLTNVALNKPADISSTYGGTELPPGGAVDGKITTTYSTGIIHTKSKQDSSWWTVDLQTQVQDATVKIYFRTHPEYEYRRSGVQLYTSTTPFSTYPSGQLCHTFNGSNIPDVGSANCIGTWEYLMVYTNTKHAGVGAVLQFGEVEVWVCSAGTYGTNCDKSCTSRQCAVTATSCDRYSGACPAGGCKTGWRGTDCTQVCMSGSYGMGCNSSCTGRKCSTSSSTACHHVTGECDQRCQPGWREIDCSQVCLSGSYGPGCNSSCTGRKCSTSSSASCHHVTGECDQRCQPGWREIDCSQACMSGSYGMGCNSSCTGRKCSTSSSTACHHVTGECDQRCQPGWREIDCSQVCMSGSYGMGCNSSCTGRKCSTSSSAACHHVTGECDQRCQPGWREFDCSQDCSSGSYGNQCNQTCSSRHCVTSSDTCNHVTGVCSVDGCEAGWMGSDCTQECTAGTYGSNCEKSCSSRQCMMPSSNCDRVTGQCPDGCQVGWIGVDCTNVCPNGNYGSNCTSPCRKCAGEICNDVTGNCTGGCKRGWKGILCCSNGTYGPGCNSTCGKCVDNGSCNHVTGKCAGGCQAGWTGNQCKETCNNKTYGVNCNEECGQCTGGNCDGVTGNCPSGCQPGYKGPQCQAFQGPGDVLVPAVAGAVAGVLVILIIVIIIVLYRRRKHASDSRKSISESHAALNDGNVYVNLTLHEEVVGEKNRTEKWTNQAAPETKQSETKFSEVAEQEEEMLDEEETTNRDYYNDSGDVIREIHVTELENIVSKIKHRKGGFDAEYCRLPTGFTAPYSDSQKPENAGKNKFRGYYPYDHNRVRLTLLPDIPGSDYINASIMHSYDKSKTYIAAQAPNKKTVGDFWRMIWEQRCGRIIMLTGLVEDRKVKCYQYWPEKGLLETDHFRVEVETTDTRANYTVRNIKVSSKDSHESRSVIQYHYTSWPDHGIPDTLALVNFIWMMRRTDTQTDGPLLVHCSAGIGRTGTYIAVDSLLDQAQREGMVDVMGYVSVMRGQRKNMIQTKEQYECVFQCLVEMTKFGDTSMDVDTFTNSYISSGMDSIVDLKTLRKVTKMLITEKSKGAPSRHQMWVDGNQDFIVRVGPTMRKINGHLLVETPSPGLVKLLWKLVEENDVHNVVVISPSQVELYGKLGSTNKYEGVSLKTKNQTTLTPELSRVTLQIQTKNDDSSHSVTLYRLGSSPTVDNISSSLLDHTHLQDLSAATSPVVVIHDNPDRKCAVSFCMMGNILSGIVEDNRVDVIGHVRTFLKCCPDLNFTEDDVEHLHEFAQKCVQMTTNTNTYANL